MLMVEHVGMQAASQLYINAARTHLTNLLAALTDAAAAGQMGRTDGSTRALSPPDLSSVHSQLSSIKRLLQVRFFFVWTPSVFV